MPKQTLFVAQGTDFSTPMLLEADDGTPINVAGYIFSGVVRKNGFSVNASAILMISVLDAANGNTLIHLDAANTADMEALTYDYTVQMKDRSNTTSILLEGFFIVTPSYTLEQPVSPSL